MDPHDTNLNRNLAKTLAMFLPTIRVVNVNHDYFSVAVRDAKKPASVRQWWVVSNVSDGRATYMFFTCRSDRIVQVWLKEQFEACGCDPQPSFLVM